MDGNAGLVMLMQLIAALFGYGDLAEQAARGSRRQRAHMLARLRTNEAVAWRVVTRRMQGAGLPMPALHALMPDCDGDSVDDALALAARFRSLAIILMQLLAAHLAPRDPWPVTRSDRSASTVSALLTGLTAARRPALHRSCFDTC